MTIEKLTTAECIAELDKRIETAQKAIASEFTPSYAKQDWEKWLAFDMDVRAKLLAAEKMDESLSRIEKRLRDIEGLEELIIDSDETLGDVLSAGLVAYDYAEGPGGK